LVQGDVKIVENGEGFSKKFKKFQEKFEWVRNDPWDENEAPFIVITPFAKTSRFRNRISIEFPCYEICFGLN